MIANNFCAYILSHGRADNVKTFKTLRKHGYSGNIRIVCDSDDSQIEEYRKLYEVDVFNKEDYKNRIQFVDNFNRRDMVVFARHAVFDIAKKNGHKYFVMLDDDYNTFGLRYVYDGRLLSKNKKLDNIFSYFVEFLKNTNTKTIAFSQGGDFIGGAKNFASKNKVLRKSMNAFFCDCDNPIDFLGTINEDTNTYTRYSQLGELYFTYLPFYLSQTTTQKSKGGLSDIYLDQGTFVKSFYTVILAPNCCVVAKMGNKHKRFHHRIAWNNCAPKILGGKWKLKN